MNLRLRDENVVNKNVEDDKEAELGKIVNKDESRLEIMNEEYSTLADNIHDDFNSVVSSNPETVFSEEDLEILDTGANLSEKNEILEKLLKNL